MEGTLNLKESFLNFLKSSKKYTTQLNNLINTNKRLFSIDLSDIQTYSSDLHLEIIKNFFINLEDLKNTFLLFVSQHTNTSEWQLSFYNTYLHKFRDLKSIKLGTLISFTGTVTRSSVVRPELVEGVFLCKLCNQKSKKIPQQFKFTEPLYCLNKLCAKRKSWDLKMDESTFSNWQKVTVQESTTEIPPGALPRTIDVILRDELVESVKPGSNTLFTGTLIVVPEDLFLMLPQSKTIPLISGNKNYLNVKGVNQKFVFLCSNVSQNEIEVENESISKILFEKENISNLQSENKMNHSFLNVNEGVKGVYERMSESLFPNIFGHRSIKNAILLMLVGGVKKVKENIKLRGDINILLVGDPGTAKSQFLKQCSKIMDRSIYTSGKSSSAAGLTACVVKEEGEFTIEAGALMLSDNGYCCIDEFDKMNENDRVAIHEAMEQQTISISKAGINATLNAKCSILAAANPINGRYDKKKTLRQNINLSAPIMSRFDLYFVLIDEIDRNSDENIATFILQNHFSKESNIFFKNEDLKNYLIYCRNLQPCLTEEAKELLLQKYILLRQESLVSNNNYKITIRNLESMIRLSEAIAKIHCDLEVKPVYVSEAFRLIKSSVLEVKKEDLILECKEKSKKVNYKDYERITNNLIYLLKVKDNLTKETLIDDYLKGIENNLLSEEDYFNEKSNVELTIDFLIEKEGVLFMEGEYVFIHPNFDI